MEQEIRDNYAHMGVSLAAYWPLFDRWAAQSQYGYVLDWFSSEAEAEAHSLAYYRDRMNLIRQ